MTTGILSADLATGLRALWERNRGALLDQAATLEDAIAAASDGTLDDEARHSAERTAHKLIGSVGAYGFLRAAGLARELEQRMAAGPLDMDGVIVCAELVEQLTVELDVAEPPSAASAQAETPAVSTTGTILVIHSDQSWRHAVAVAASDRALTVLQARSPSEAEAMVQTSRPGVVVLPIDNGDGGASAMKLLDALDKQDPRTPTILIGNGTNVMDRVQASRRGVARFIDLDTDPTHIIQAVVDLIGDERNESARVLMVDDDDHVLNQARALLEADGFVVDTLNDPGPLWTTLETATPDIVVLDWEMPNVTGAELCEALRADPRWTNLPVLVLTGHTDGDTLRAAFRAGADDFVAKPVVGPVLAGRIRNRLERLRLLQELADSDVLTGLPHRRAGHRELERLLASADRSHAPAALALVEVDGLNRATRTHGHEVGDRILTSVATSLRRQFRGREIVASWATGRFLIGMFGLPKLDAVQRVADVLEQIRMEPVITITGERVSITLSGGVAEFPADGITVDQLVYAADDAAAAAADMGGNRVLPAGWNPEDDPALVDVAIVEDDEQLAELVAHALTTRGYRSRWLRDGVEAVEALVGTDATPPSLQPRVVLLDVNLPGMSGMAVLRRLAEINALSRTRVVMLTARTAEADVIEALAMGAVDHVGKPFSVPVLIERLRHHLPS